MKQSILIFFCLSVINLFAQQNNSVIEIQTGEKGLGFFTEMGIFPTHGYLKKSGKFTGIFDLENFEAIRNSKLSFDEFVSNKAASIHSCFGNVPDYQTPAGWQLGSMGGFYTYSEVLAELDTMYALYPSLITPKTQISNCLSIEGRPIQYLKISDNPNVQENEPQILFTAVHHSQEPASVQQLIFFMYYLLENYGTNPEITYLVNNTEIYFIPFVNPDGYVYNQTQNPNGGGLWRKNRRNNGLSYGVDLNRNYKYAFAFDEIGSSSIGFHVWYRGDSAFSEPETQAMKFFLENHEIRIALNWHAYGNMIIYPWNYKNYYTEDSSYFETLSKKVSSKNHYRFGTVHETYGYQSNGDADDWGYGELLSKNKIISFTGECGNMDDGFWPSVSRIEPICKEALFMNLELLNLASKYADVTDNSESVIKNSNGYIPFKVQCLGVDTPANFTVTFSPLTNNISFPYPQKIFSGMSLMTTVFDSIEYHCTLSSNAYQQVLYTITINNGSFSRIDTVIRYTGQNILLFEDDCENMNKWTGDDFGVSNAYSTSGNFSITESPSGNYSLLQSSEIVCNNVINLQQAEKAFINFRARWNLEKNYDYMQLLVSVDNGNSWQPLCGRYTTPGSDDEDEGQPVYDGIMNEWVYEEVDISNFINNNIRLKIKFYSDQTTTRDGFYFDDFKITALYNSSDVRAPLIVNKKFSVFVKNKELQIVPQSLINENFTVKIYTSQGQKLSEIKLNKNGGIVNLNEYCSGIYFYQIVCKDGYLETSKFVL